MGVWNAHTSVGNILGAVIPAAFINSNWFEINQHLCTDLYSRLEQGSCLSGSVANNGLYRDSDLLVPRFLFVHVRSVCVMNQVLFTDPHDVGLPDLSKVCNIKGMLWENLQGICSPST